jgi:hypothetical protein
MKNLFSFNWIAQEEDLSLLSDLTENDNNQLTEEPDALSASVQSLQSQLKILKASATSPLALVPLARQLLELARKSAALPLAEL